MSTSYGGGLCMRTRLGPGRLGATGASRGPWSRGVRVCVAGCTGTMVDLRDVDADEVGRALGLAGSQSRHSRAMAVGSGA